MKSFQLLNNLRTLLNQKFVHPSASHSLEGTVAQFFRSNSVRMLALHINIKLSLVGTELYIIKSHLCFYYCLNKLLVTFMSTAIFSEHFQTNLLWLLKFEIFYHVKMLWKYLFINISVKLLFSFNQ